jgi:DNA-binding HxlR family transcriptional regulator
MMSSSYEKVMDVITGRWKSQILYAGVKLGVFESVSNTKKSASEIAAELGLDPALSYRLLRALASLGFLSEDDGKNFAITPMGELLRQDHPQTLRA